MSLSTLLETLDDWCGPAAPGHPPRPEWLRDMLTAVVLAELSSTLGDTAESRALYDTAGQLYLSAADKVALNPQPLPPLEGQPRQA